MDKGIGFNRNIKLDWLDATAAFCTETDDTAEIRARLEPVLAQDRTGKEAIRKSIDILINIWFKSREIAPALHKEALNEFQRSSVAGDRLWLHYGLTILNYPFFWQCARAIGQIIRYEDMISNRMVINRLTSEMGELGSLERSVQRVVASLRDWGIITDAKKRNCYTPKYRTLTASTNKLESWLLACALHAYPGEELPFPDLPNLPALFPFSFMVSTNDLRQSGYFELQRQGMGLEMVRLQG